MSTTDMQQIYSALSNIIIVLRSYAQVWQNTAVASIVRVCQLLQKRSCELFRRSEQCTLEKNLLKVKIYIEKGGILYM